MRRIREIEISDTEPSGDKIWLRLKNGTAELYCHINGNWEKITSATSAGGGGLTKEELDAINEQINEISQSCVTANTNANIAKTTAQTANTTASEANTLAQDAKTTASEAKSLAEDANRSYNTFANQVSTFTTRLEGVENDVKESNSYASEALGKADTVSGKVDNISNEIISIKESIKELSLTADNVSLTTDDANLTGASNVKDALEKIAAKVWYTAITFKNTSASPEAKTYEIGKTLDAPTITWTTSKTPTAITVNGTAIDKSSTSYTLTSPLTSTTNVTVKVTDEMGGKLSNTFTWTFGYAVYTGMATIPTEYTQSWVKRTIGGKSVKTSAAGNYTMKGSTTNEYWWIAVPSAWNVKFFTGIGPIDMDLMATLTDFVNDEGKTVPMKIYKAQQVQGSDTTITVKQ